MMPYDAYSITINVYTMSLVDIIPKKWNKMMLLNIYYSKANNAIIQLFQILFVQSKY